MLLPFARILLFWDPPPPPPPPTAYSVGNGSPARPPQTQCEVRKFCICTMLWVSMNNVGLLSYVVSYQYCVTCVLRQVRYETVAWCVTLSTNSVSSITSVKFSLQQTNIVHRTWCGCVVLGTLHIFILVAWTRRQGRACPAECLICNHTLRLRIFLG